MLVLIILGGTLDFQKYIHVRVLWAIIIIHHHDRMDIVYLLLKISWKFWRCWVIELPLLSACMQFQTLALSVRLLMHIKPTKDI